MCIYLSFVKKPIVSTPRQKGLSLTWVAIIVKCKAFNKTGPHDYVQLNGNPLEYSCLENPMDRGDWRATVGGTEKESVQLNTIDGLLKSLITIWGLVAMYIETFHICDKNEGKHCHSDAMS